MLELGLLVQSSTFKQLVPALSFQSTSYAVSNLAETLAIAPIKNVLHSSMKFAIMAIFSQAV